MGASIPPTRSRFAGTLFGVGWLALAGALLALTGCGEFMAQERNASRRSPLPASPILRSAAGVSRGDLRAIRETADGYYNRPPSIIAWAGRSTATPI